MGVSHPISEDVVGERTGTYPESPIRAGFVPNSFQGLKSNAKTLIFEPPSLPAWYIELGCQVAGGLTTTERPRNLMSLASLPGAAAQSGRSVVAVLGPTNTGKTHLAIERMLGHASGMIGLPLRLLAREVYDRVAARAAPTRWP